MKYSLLFFVFAFFGYTCSPVRQYAESAQAWEKDMQTFDALNRQETYPDSAILFVGSSSIRLWDSIAQDLSLRSRMFLPGII